MVQRGRQQVIDRNAVFAFEKSDGVASRRELESTDTHPVPGIEDLVLSERPRHGISELQPHRVAAFIAPVDVGPEVISSGMRNTQRRGNAAGQILGLRSGGQLDGETSVRRRHGSGGEGQCELRNIGQFENYRVQRQRQGLGDNVDAAPGSQRREPGVMVSSHGSDGLGLAGATREQQADEDTAKRSHGSKIDAQGKDGKSVV